MLTLSRWFFKLPSWLLFALFIFPFALGNFIGISFYLFGYGTFDSVIISVLSKFSLIASFAYPIWLFCISETAGNEGVGLKRAGRILFLLESIILLIEVLDMGKVPQVSFQFFQRIGSEETNFLLNLFPYLLKLGFSYVAAKSYLALMQLPNKAYREFMPIWVLLFFFPFGVWVLQPKLNAWVAENSET